MHKLVFPLARDFCNWLQRFLSALRFCKGGSCSSTGVAGGGGGVGDWNLTIFSRRFLGARHGGDAGLCLSAWFSPVKTLAFAEEWLLSLRTKDDSTVIHVSRSWTKSRLEFDLQKAILKDN
jgi:hypothetical protein